MKTLDFNEMVEIQGGDKKQEAETMCVILYTAVGASFGWFGALVGLVVGALVCGD